MNLIRGLKKVSDVKDIPAADEQYIRIAMWKALYTGFYQPFHKVTYQTVNGQKTRQMASLGMAKVAAQEIATLVFNEKCMVNISDKQLQTNIDDVFKQNCFSREFQRYLEYQFALGGLALKVFVENGKIKISFVTADNFVPLSWNHDNITEGVFVNEFYKNGIKYTHLEWNLFNNGIYTIRNELYESKHGEELGVKIPLNALFPDLQPETIIENVERPFFAYIKPNTANNIDMNSPLGISIYANAVDTLRAIDTAFDSFEREFKLGKKRILVPASAIRQVVDPTTGAMTRYFDANDEVYEAFNFDDSMNRIEDISVELRVEEHIAALNALLTHFSMQIGFSAGAFTFDAAGLKTATEVISENSKTFRTKQAHETIVEAGLQELVKIIVDVAELYGIFPAPAGEYDVTVTFDDSIAEDKATNANYYILLSSSGLVSKVFAMQKILGLTEEQAKQMLQEINNENATVQGENIDLFGPETGGDNSGAIAGFGGGGA
jgi:A118 family predicted phage portal protein